MRFKREPGQGEATGVFGDWWAKQRQRTFETGAILTEGNTKGKTGSLKVLERPDPSLSQRVIRELAGRPFIEARAQQGAFLNP